MRLIYICIALLLISMAFVNCSKEDTRKKKKKHKGSSSDVSSYSYSSDYSLFSDYTDSSESVKKKKNKHKKKHTHTGSPMFDLKGELMKRFVFNVVGTQASAVCSPAAALLPLGKLVFGTTGTARQQIFKAIGVGSTKQVESFFKFLIDKLRNVRGVQLGVTSKVYLNKDKKARSKFKDQIQKVFPTGIETINMKDPNGEIEKINYWLTRETFGLVRGVGLKPSDLNSKTNLMLLNVMFLKTKWKYAFQKSKTVETFYGAAGGRPVTMMRVSQNFEVGESSSLGSRAIKIPLEHSQANMIVILPYIQAGLPTLISQLRLAPTLLNTIKFNKKKTKLTLPEFRVETTINLPSQFMMLNIKEIFINGLEKIVEGGKVKLDIAKHKVVFEVVAQDNGGFAGYDVGSAGPKNTWGREDEFKFEVNRPFMFFVMMNGQQLIAGVFTAS